MDRTDEVTLSRPASKSQQRGRVEVPAIIAERREPVAAEAESIGLRPGQRAAKRAFDIAAAIVLFTFFSPLVLVVAVMVAITTGRPVIFGHTRVGRHSRPFKCLKFRSMVKDADAVLAHLLATDEEARIEWERDFKLKNDPRVTRFGRFIRKTSLDEFPQFWNVIKGDMSIVGPRPVVRQELDLYYADAREHYLAVKPGLTGMWQISGRNDMDYSERVALDRAYVESWSLGSDFSIMMRTVKVLIGRSGGY